MSRENPERRARRREVDEFLRAIRSGVVDALIMSGRDGDQVYTLKGADHKYRVMVEAMSEGAVMLTPAGIVFYSNPCFAAMLDFPLDQVIGSAMDRFVLPEDLPGYHMLIGHATSGVGRGDVRLTHARGSQVPAHLSISSFRSGALRGLCVVVTDLTEHRRHQKLPSAETLERTKRAAAEASQQRIATILEGITDSFFAVDHTWLITDANQRGAESFGTSLDQLVGRSLWDVSPTGRLPELDESYRRAMTDRVAIHQEGRSPTACGKWFERHIYPVDNGLAVYLRDVTTRKRAEEELRRSEALLAEGQRLSRTASWILNTETGELFFSAELYRLWGLDPATFPLTVESARTLIHPGDRETMVDAFETALREGLDFEREFRIVRPDGSIRQIRSVGRPVKEAGIWNEYVGTVMDITDRKVEEAARDELRRRLIASQEDERRRIALEMHDQFGQQLSALVLKLSALKRETGQRVNLADQLDALEGIARQLDRDLEHIVGRLRPTALDDFGLVPALEHYTRHWSEHFQVPVELHTTGMDSGQLTDELDTALYRITQEALNNVARHAHANHVSIVLDQRAERVSVIVEDDGVGFEADQPESTRQRFGLIGMRERATLLGGTLDIESHPDVGTTVVARLPLVPPRERGSP